MRKHNEGYAFVLVLVVITILCLVAMAMMAGSLKNLQNQQRSIDQMEAKYEALGELEKFIAKFEKKIKTGGDDVVLSAEIINTDMGPAGVLIECVSVEYFSDGIDAQGVNRDYLLISLKTAEELNAAVTCTLKVTGTINPGANSAYSVKRADLEWEYASYAVTQGGGEE